MGEKPIDSGDIEYQVGGMHKNLPLQILLSHTLSSDNKMCIRECFDHISTDKAIDLLERYHTQIDLVPLFNNFYAKFPGSKGRNKSGLFAMLTQDDPIYQSIDEICAELEINSPPPLSHRDLLQQRYTKVLPVYIRLRHQGYSHHDCIA